MPHGRKKGKRVVGMWIDEALFKAIDDLARRSGLPRSAVAEQMIRKELGVPDANEQKIPRRDA